jgi:hypothetical protein
MQKYISCPVYRSSSKIIFANSNINKNSNFNFGFRYVHLKPKGRRNIGRPRKNGGNNFILRIKEQETHLILRKHDDDNDDVMCIYV